MSEQNSASYVDGDVVWVKLGSCWWPGEVVGPDKLPPDVMPSFRKPPIAVVKFFQENSYEYVKNPNFIFKYNCDRKDEFIKKGLDIYRSKHGHMEKFPEDVIRAETAIGGDIKILTRDEFQETKRESYKGLFGSSSATKKTVKGGKGRPRTSSETQNMVTTPRRKVAKNSDYQVHILVQGPKVPSVPVENIPIPSGSRLKSTDEKSIEQNQNSAENGTPVSSIPMPSPLPTSGTPTGASGAYSCHTCSFKTSRLNVMIMHNKSHSISYRQYIPTPTKSSPARIITPKPAKILISSPVSTKKKAGRPRVDKVEKTLTPDNEEKKEVVLKPKKVRKSVKSESEKPITKFDKPIPQRQNKKRKSEETKNVEEKKLKTEEEIKSSLLADWDDDAEDIDDESSFIEETKSPKIPVESESPSAPVPAELPSSEELSSPKKISELPSLSKKSEENEKPESSTDSKYDFREDEDWPMESAGRKIPRLKKLSHRKDEKSLSIDEEEVAKEVAELLSKTVVPELPSIPSPLKVEENFPKGSEVKSPDKKPEISDISKGEASTTTKAIFKTKTFFRSRHSRSQDIIGKYVAEQLNAAEKMDMDTDINGSDVASSPEARESPPIESFKVTRMTPKLQLKKHKASMGIQKKTSLDDNDEKRPAYSSQKSVESTQDFLYPSQEIKPINSDVQDIRTEKYSNNNKAHLKIESEMIEVSREESIQILQQETFSKMNFKASFEQAPADVLNVNTCISDSTQSCLNGKETEVEEPNKACDDLPSNFINDTTASAVDALLSVSREADKVTKVLSSGPPEDLFEDDINRESGSAHSLNGIDESLKSENTLKISESQSLDKEESTYTALPCTTSQSTLLDLVTAATEQEAKENANVNVNNQSQLLDLISAASEERVEEESMTDIVLSGPSTNKEPSESDLQIAEALINLPSMQSKATDELILKSCQETVQDHMREQAVENVEKLTLSINNNKYEQQQENQMVESNDLNSDIKICPETDIIYESELEKCENLNAAQSLVEMSRNAQEKVALLSENSFKESVVTSSIGPNTEIKKLNLLQENAVEAINGKATNSQTSPSKLLKLLEEPTTSQVKAKTTKHSIQGNEKILNFEVSQSAAKLPSPSNKQKIIIRRSAVTHKNKVSSFSDITSSPDKIVLAPAKQTTGNPHIQSYTIEATAPSSSNFSSDSQNIMIQQQLVSSAKPSSAVNKPKQRTSLLSPHKESKIVELPTSTTDEAMFDINSMPMVLSDDIITPENIDKMPMVMSDGNIVTNPPKLITNRHPEKERKKETIIINSVSSAPNKPEMKTLVINPVTETGKVTTTPNILSRSVKARSVKPMLIIDKNTGVQKIIMAKKEPPAVKEIKQAVAPIQSTVTNVSSTKAEKFIILPAANSPKPVGRTQKIVIDPNTGKAHMLVSKGPEVATKVNEKNVIALKPSAPSTNTPGNTVMIITNAQGAQSKIVLTAEHEKILFPNKQQGLQTTQKGLQLISQKVTAAPTNAQKMEITSPQPKVVKQKTTTLSNAIITSKGQLIVGSQVTTTTSQSPTTPSQVKVAQKKVVETKKIIQAPQKTTKEPLIFLQQKSGAIMQLTAAQFEHLQKTGQIVQKVSEAKVQEKPIQKSIVITPKEQIQTQIKSQTPKPKRPAVSSGGPPKKIKKEIVIRATNSASLVSEPPALTPPIVTTLTPLSPEPVPAPPLVPISSSAPVSSAIEYPQLDNFEEMLPSTAIVRQPELIVEPLQVPSPAPLIVEPLQVPSPAPPPPATVPPAQLADGSLLAVPGEHFGLAAGTFYLCVEENGGFTPIDNRPLVLENNQLVPVPERRDILEAALASSDVLVTEDEAPDFRDLNAAVSVHSLVSETSSTLHQPIMTPVELPTTAEVEPRVPADLDAGLAVIGVTPHTIPTSLELPITVTDPRIAPKTTDPLSSTMLSSSTEMMFVSDEHETIVSAMSMPLLSEEEAVSGKSMPILTDDLADRTVSSVSTGSPCSIEVPETEDGTGQWSRRLLTPSSDISEVSAEIPLQPSLQLSTNDLAR